LIVGHAAAVGHSASYTHISASTMRTRRAEAALTPPRAQWACARVPPRPAAAAATGARAAPRHARAGAREKSAALRLCEKQHAAASTAGTPRTLRRGCVA
jgi:hypothetical protein